MMSTSAITDILDNQENGIIILDKKKEVLYVNKSSRRLLGNDLNQLLGNYLNCKNTIIEQMNCQTTSKCSSCSINNAIENVIKTGEDNILNGINVDKKGIEIKLSMKISLYEEKFILIELFNLDIKDNYVNFLYNLVEKSRDFIFFKDRSLRYIYLNKEYAKFLNKDRDYIIGKTDVELLNEKLLDENLYNQCEVGDKRVLKEGYYDSVEVIGNQYFKVSKENIDGGIIGIARDITREINAIKKSETDPLTGIYNRNKFEETIEEIYSKNEKNYYLTLIDLDDLRGLNNGYGHLMGDKYLKELGGILKEQHKVVFYRIGGDEFAGLINCNQAYPKEIIESIFHEINKLNLIPKLSVSVGVGKLDIDKEYIENYEKVDKILYEVKSNGKNKFIIR